MTTTLAVAVLMGGIVGILLASFIIVAGLTVWAVLIVRTTLVYVSVMAGPLIFAARSIPPPATSTSATSRAASRSSVEDRDGHRVRDGVGDARRARSPMSFGQAIGAVMQALAILLIATFSPFIFIKLLIGAGRS